MQSYEIFLPNVLSQSTSLRCKIEDLIVLRGHVGVVLSGAVSENRAVLGYESFIATRLAGTGDLLNLESIFNDEKGHSEFVCESPTAEVAVVGADYFRRGIGHPSTHQEVQLAMAKELMRRLYQHQCDINDTFANFSHGRIEDRILWALRRLQKVVGTDVLHIRQRRLAAHLGVAKETVSRAMGGLAAAGKLEKTGYHEITLTREGL